MEFREVSSDFKPNTYGGTHAVFEIVFSREVTGIAQVEAAKADGRWEAAYASPVNMKVPDDFLKELSKNQKAQAFFKTLNKSNVFAIAYNLHTAKKPETRERRMKKFLEMMERGEKFY